MALKRTRKMFWSAGASAAAGMATDAMRARNLERAADLHAHADYLVALRKQQSRERAQRAGYGTRKPDPRFVRTGGRHQ